MLKKMFTYDFRTARVWLLPLTVAPIPLGILSGLLYWLVSTTNNIPLTIFCVAFLFVSVLGTYLCAPVLSIFLIVRFYKSVFTDEGYLTMSLPMDSRTLLLSKTLFTACFSVAGIISMFMGILSFVGIVSINQLDIIFSNLPEIYHHLLSYVGGKNFILLSVEALLYLIASTSSSILLIFLSVTAGVLVFKRHRFLGFLLFYFAFSSVLGGIGSVAYSIIIGLGTTLFGEAAPAVLLHLFIWLVILMICGVCVGLFYALNYLISRKLNLA